MGPCDIKSSAKAWNDGIDAFKKAFKQTDGKTTESIKFAIDEINKNNPDFKFDVNSFTDPLIKSLKEKDIIPKSYTFKTSASSSSVESKINKIAEKMNGLSGDQKKSFAKKSFSQFEKYGMLTDEKVKNIYSEAIGIPAMDEKVDEQIKKTSKALQAFNDVQSEINGKIKEMQDEKTNNDGKLSPEKNKEYSKIFNDLAEKKIKATADMMKEKAAFSNMLIEKKFWMHQLGDYMPLNLMNPRSLAKNMSGAVVDGVMRALANTIASPVSLGVSMFTGINSNPIGSKIKGSLAGKFKSKAALAWKHGQTDFTSELPNADHFNASNRFKKAMDATGFEKFKGVISAALKIHPSIISKGLTVPDAMVYESVMSAELNRIADSKKLTGAEKKAFMLEPDEKSHEIATKIAQRVTFKQDVPDVLSKLSAYDPHEATKKIIAKKEAAGEKYSPLAIKILTGSRAMFQKSVFPFIKTPINIVRTSSRMLLPEYELGQSLMAAHKEKDATERQRLVIEATAKATVGFFIRHIALQMVAQGLMSAGFNDEDKKTKDIVEQELGGPNRMNWSAFIRGLTFQDMKKKKGDQIVDMSALGAMGITMNVYSHTFGKYSKDELNARKDYNKNLIDATAGIPKDLAIGQLTSSLDQTFLSGLNQVMSAMSNDNGFETNKFLVQMVANVFTGIVPSTGQQFSTQESPNVKKQFDAGATFGENLAKRLGYNFAGQSKDLENKYFSLAEEGKGGLKKKNYMLLDNYLGRVLESELDFVKLGRAETDTPISRLHEALKEVPKDDRDKLFPSSIGRQQTINGVKHGKRYSYKAELNNEQFEYLENQASKYRMMLATPFIMSDDFKKVDFETKTKVLQSFYEEGLNYAQKDFKKQFPDIKEQEIEGTHETKALAKKITKKYKTKNATD